MNRSVYVIFKDLVISLCIIFLGIKTSNVFALCMGCLFFIFNILDLTSKNGINLYEIKNVKNDSYIVNGIILKIIYLINSLIIIFFGVFFKNLYLISIGSILLIIVVIDIRFKIPLYRIKK